ncbi:pectinesterase family protein [Geofilum sp. OHC36d9]|uniref:pectinesterase family protein n=1 Tax=Geofilum sp. OHC36d9 TaxID=3458413 RepID=UPI00403496A1
MKFLVFVGLMMTFVWLPVMGDEQNAHFVVAADGSGDFVSVQDAIDAVPHFRKVETIIFIKNGVYKEKLILPQSKNRVTLIGESKEGTILTNDDFAQKKNRFGEEMGTTGSSGFFVFGDDFLARNITFENSAGPVGQAVAVRVSGDRAVFDNCRFLGFQDTLYPNQDGSRQFYRNCYIEGTVDFIFGWATVWFQGCDIFCKAPGYVTAASTEKERAYGFVFNKCRVTGDAPAGTVYLGRPWRNYAQTVFIDCYLGDVIHSKGWHNWNKKEAEVTAFYAEYGTKGPGVKGERAKWAHQLTSEQRSAYTIEKVLGGDDNWDPRARLNAK